MKLLTCKAYDRIFMWGALPFHVQCPLQFEGSVSPCLVCASSLFQYFNCVSCSYTEIIYTDYKRILQKYWRKKNIKIKTYSWKPDLSRSKLLPKLKSFKPDFFPYEAIISLANEKFLKMLIE